MSLGPSDLAHFSTAKMTCQNNFSCLILMGVMPWESWDSWQQNLLQLKIMPHELSLFGKKKHLMIMWGIKITNCGRNKNYKLNFSGNKHFWLGPLLQVVHFSYRVHSHCCVHGCTKLQNYIPFLIIDFKIIISMMVSMILCYTSSIINTSPALTLTFLSPNLLVIPIILS